MKLQARADWWPLWHKRTRRRGAAWLAWLALAGNLLAPALCLAQMLSAAPLGEICSAESSGTTAADTQRGNDPAGLHVLQHCDDCAAPAVFIAASPPWVSVPKRALLPRPRAAPVLAQAIGSWRPPPRGPPLVA